MCGIGAVRTAKAEDLDLSPNRERWCRALLAGRLERMRAHDVLHPDPTVALEDAIGDLARDGPTPGDALTTACTLVRLLETAPPAGRGTDADDE